MRMGGDPANIRGARAGPHRQRERNRNQHFPANFQRRAGGEGIESGINPAFHRVFDGDHGGVGLPGAYHPQRRGDIHGGHESGGVLAGYLLQCGKAKRAARAEERIADRFGSGRGLHGVLSCVEIA